MSSSSATHHILPLRLYVAVAMGLLILTAATVAVAQFQFGAFNLLIAMLIAAIKATLVALFFMHLKYDSRIYTLIFSGSILFLAVFIIFTMFDTLHRGDIYEQTSRPLQDAKIYQNSVVADSVQPTELTADTLQETGQQSQ